MKRIVFQFLLIFSSYCLMAQEIKVKDIVELTTDIRARTHERTDGNGNPCALIIVTIPMVKDMSFTGWVVGKTEYHPGEYWVYVPERTKKIKFQHENFHPGEIEFPKPVHALTVYRVMLDVPDITKYATECTAFVAEGGRLFALREYGNARNAYLSAIKSQDAPKDILKTIQSDLDLCDSCLKYERYAMGTLGKMGKLRSGNASQEEVVKYASAAKDFLEILNNYNPCEFYSTRIEKLEKIVDELPLDIRFTVVKWEKTYEGFVESGGLGNVEIWGYYGYEDLTPNDYLNDKAFRKTMKMSDKHKLLATTDENGEVDVHLDRKALPKAFVFRPIGYDKSAKIHYENMENVLTNSKEEYNKRQFRLKMYVSND